MDPVWHLFHIHVFHISLFAPNCNFLLGVRSIHRHFNGQLY